MRRFLWFALGLALLSGGVVLAVTAQHPSETDFGWFAYTPLEHPEGHWWLEWSDGSQGVIVTRGQIIGSAVAGLGLLLLGCGAAYQLGRRQRPTT